jgi:hypothetical protein
MPELLAEVLRGTPKLPGALCVKVPTIMDGTDDETIALALKVCSRCPCRQRCAAWAASLPVGALTGVVGGIVYRPPGSGGASQLRPRT